MEVCTFRPRGLQCDPTYMLFTHASVEVIRLASLSILALVLQHRTIYKQTALRLVVHCKLSEHSKKDALYHQKCV